MEKVTNDIRGNYRQTLVRENRKLAAGPFPPLERARAWQAYFFGHQLRDLSGAMIAEVKAFHGPPAVVRSLIRRQAQYKP